MCVVRVGGVVWCVRVVRVCGVACVWCGVVWCVCNCLSGPITKVSVCDGLSGPITKVRS